jgi:hypothetical protein
MHVSVRATPLQAVPGGEKGRRRVGAHSPTVYSVSDFVSQDDSEHCVRRKEDRERHVPVSGREGEGVSERGATDRFFVMCAARANALVVDDATYSNGSSV